MNGQVASKEEGTPILSPLVADGFPKGWSVKVFFQSFGQGDLALGFFGFWLMVME